MPKICTALILALVTSTSLADQASHEAAARRLLEVSEASTQIDTVYDTMVPHLKQMSEQMGVKPENKEVFDRHMERVFAALREEFNWEMMEPMLVEVYVDVYTEDELHGLIAFYESPTGRAFVKKMPRAMEASMQKTQQLLGGFYGRIEELSQELKKDMEASAGD